VFGDLMTMRVGPAAPHCDVGAVGYDGLYQAALSPFAVLQGKDAVLTAGLTLGSRKARGAPAQAFFRHYSGFSGSPVVAY
jgi:hypothetical protein